MPARRVVRHSPHRRRQVITKPKLLHRHGCLVRVFGLGVFLRGPSGSGKSLAVFELIRRGHALIADDMVKMQKLGSKLMGKATPPLAGYLHIQGIGLIDVAKALGKKALLSTSSIDFIIEYLEPGQAKSYNHSSSRQWGQLAGVKLPIYKMKSETSAGFIEAAVLKEKGRTEHPEKKLNLAVRRLMKPSIKQKSK